MKITILGSGGHGWTSLNNYITTVNHEIDFWYLPVDWGGFTGLFGRLMEKENRGFNSALHKKVAPVFPWGDMNKLIGFFIESKYDSKLRQHFEVRHHLIKEENERLLSDMSNDLIEFCNTLDVDKKTLLEGLDYLGKCLDEINYSYDSLKYNCKKGSISNFWNNFIFSQEYNMQSFNYFYQRVGVLPYNISLNFVGKDRFVLVGDDSKGNRVIGEELVDENYNPITPESFRLEKINGEPVSIRDLGEFEYKLQLADYIIIPNGSIANWLPLVNYDSIKNILIEKSKEGRVIAFMNLFHTKNEYQYSYYLKYLNTLGISTLVIGPRLHHIILNKSLIKAYERENKFLNDLENMETENYLACLEVVSQEELSEIVGVKYSPTSVSKVLKLLIR
jgi:hypothetical protein